jgi:nucleotide-binding universal stress UspA family protein
MPANRCGRTFPIEGARCADTEATMYKSIILATDGSEFAEKATAHAIAIAKATGARISVVYVRPAVENLVVEGVVIQIPAEQRKEMAARIEKLLDKVSGACKAAGVTASGEQIQNAQPWRGIIEHAEKTKADLIVMASHGRRGVSKLLLGSEAQQVVTHSHVPVLVVR